MVWSKRWKQAYKGIWDERIRRFRDVENLEPIDFATHWFEITPPEQ